MIYIIVLFIDSSIVHINAIINEELCATFNSGNTILLNHNVQGNSSIHKILSDLLLR